MLPTAKPLQAWQGPRAHQHSLTWEAMTLHLQWGGIPFLMTDALQGHTCWAGTVSWPVRGTDPTHSPNQQKNVYRSQPIHSHPQGNECSGILSMKDQKWERPEAVSGWLNSMSIPCFVCFLILLTHPKIKYIFEKEKKNTGAESPSTHTSVQNCYPGVITF